MGCLKKINKEISVRARPIFAEKTIFLGSDTPICQASRRTSCTDFQRFEIAAERGRNEEQQEELSPLISTAVKPRSGNSFTESSLSLFSAKLCLKEPYLATMIRKQTNKTFETLARLKIVVEKGNGNQDSGVELEFVIPRKVERELRNGNSKFAQARTDYWWSEDYIVVVWYCVVLFPHIIWFHKLI